MNYLYSLDLVVTILVLGAKLCARMIKVRAPILNAPDVAFNEASIAFLQRRNLISVPWAKIQSVIGYKKDGLMVDFIFLEFYTSEDFFVVDDEMLGFGDLVLSLDRFLSLKHEDWFHRIVVPAFETNLTLVYDYQDRTLNEVLAEVKGGAIN